MSGNGMSGPLSEDEILERLKAKFGQSEWVLLTQVPEDRYGRGRIADAIAVNMWMSRGREIQGFEIKTSRNDWLRELKDPSKADIIARHCDRWWIVVADESIVREGELPSSWGLLVPHPKGLSIKIKAPTLDGVLPPDRGFVIALIDRASRVVLPEWKLREAEQRGYKRGKKEAGDDASYDLKLLREAVHKFEQASGVKIGERWEAGDIGAAVKAVQFYPKAMQSLDRLQTAAETFLRAIEAAREERLPVEV